MKNAMLPTPGIVHGSYPERLGDSLKQGSAWAHWWNGDARSSRKLGSTRHPSGRRARGTASFAAFAAGVRQTSGPAPALPEVRAQLAREGLEDPALAGAFRLIDAAARTTLGIAFYDTQFIAARIMLDGQLAEMATGEGKTLAIALGAAAAALAGIPVHVITANEYLVGRDCAALQPLFGALGLTVGQVTQAATASQRRTAYACDITYCTATELGFDYLRDGLLRGATRSVLAQHAAALGGVRSPARNGTVGSESPVLRGLCMALVDEADSCLIDDARVPLILARPARNPGHADYYAQALALARRLTEGRDFAIDAAALRCLLTPSGRACIERWSSSLPAVWRNRTHREEAVSTALSALHVYQRDVHYLVREDKVVLIDGSTGRIAQGRAWSGGLQQWIELKEHCTLTLDSETCAQITFQRLFRRYWQLGGMSGTLCEARGELRAIYGLRVNTVPLHRPSRRSTLPPRLFASRDHQFTAVAQRARELAEQERPVLIGTDTVADSQTLSAHLAALNLPHQVLNAHFEAGEAAIVSQAGAAGRITIATNMAGRGTDIPLGDDVAARGGLHLICCQHNPSPRIDRQLVGRCGRQGDPGSTETMLCVEQPLVSPLFPVRLVRFLPDNGWQLPGWMALLLIRLPQWRAERRLRKVRMALLEQDFAWDQNRPVGAVAE